jgi:hypothetical protein
VWQGVPPYIFAIALASGRQMGQQFPVKSLYFGKVAAL